MEPSNRTESRERQVAECSRTIKTTAAELGIPIIVLSQLNDDGRSRESRAIEQDSDIFAIVDAKMETLRLILNMPVLVRAFGFQ